MPRQIYCTQCGAANRYGVNYCYQCGAQLAYPDPTASITPSQLDHQRCRLSPSRTHRWAGERQQVVLEFKSFFSQILCRHSEMAAENIFVAGTSTTTPPLSAISNQPVQPWLYSRVLVGMVVAILLTSLLTVLSPGIQPLLTTLLSLMVPLTLLVFFFEVNVFKNISFYLIIKVFVIGGTMAAVIVTVIYDLSGLHQYFNLGGSLAIGFIEETGKLLVGYYYVARLKLHHLFNGMLVGGAIGAGFATIENIQYATVGHSVVAIPLMRAAGSLGTHTVWCAITVTALVLVNGPYQLTFARLLGRPFAKYFLAVVILHACWDLNTPFPVVKAVLLTCGGWLMLFALIRTGLREVKLIQGQLNKEKAK